MRTSCINTLAHAAPQSVALIVVLILTCPTLQCVVTGVWKGLNVAIRVTKQESLDEAGLQFIGDAINSLK